jgi:cystathionine beta-lyase/cystathionine gamma-synthase
MWPYSATFKQTQLAHEQMQGCGGLFSFTLKNSSFKKMETFCNHLQHVLLAVSWGGHESLILPSIASLTAHEYSVTNNRHQLIRMYVGLEDPQYLINDLQQALAKIIDN